MKILVDPKTYAEFLARFNFPPNPNARLRRSLQTAGPWEKEPRSFSPEQLGEVRDLESFHPGKGSS
jgi:hypothetical protein